MRRKSYSSPADEKSVTEGELWNAVTVLCGQFDCDDDTA